MADVIDKISVLNYVRGSDVKETFEKVYETEAGREVLDYIVYRVCGFDIAEVVAEDWKRISKESKREVAGVILRLVKKNEKKED